MVRPSSPLDRVRHEHLGWLLGRADQRFATGVTEAVRAHGFRGIRLVHIALIRNVDEGGTRIGEIAKRAGMTKQATGQLVTEFVRLGYITIEADPLDGRVKRAAYTAKGTLVAAIVTSIETVEARIAATIGTNDLGALKATLADAWSSRTRRSISKSSNTFVTICRFRPHTRDARPAALCQGVVERKCGSAFR